MQEDKKLHHEPKNKCNANMDKKHLGIEIYVVMVLLQFHLSAHIVNVRNMISISVNG